MQNFFRFTQTQLITLFSIISKIFWKIICFISFFCVFIIFLFYLFFSLILPLTLSLPLSPFFEKLEVCLPFSRLLRILSSSDHGLEEPGQGGWGKNILISCMHSPYVTHWAVRLMKCMNQWVRYLLYRQDVFPSTAPLIIRIYHFCFSQ